MKHIVLRFGFLFISINCFSQTLEFEKLRSDSTIYTEDIIWDISSSRLHESSSKFLNELVLLLHENEKINASITLYEALEPQFSSNYLNKRVRSVIDYLMNKGIAPNRLRGKGHSFIEKKDWDALPQRFVIIKFERKKS